MASNEQELVLTRVFDAPRRLVFKAWTDPKCVAVWWGPHHFTNPVCELDARPGGAIRIHMRDPTGIVYPMTGIFQEVIEPERIVFTSAALDDKGNPMFEVLTTVTFAEQGGQRHGLVRLGAAQGQALDQVGGRGIHRAGRRNQNLLQAGDIGVERKQAVQVVCRPFQLFHLGLQLPVDRG